MSEPKFTPGPWTVDRDDGQNQIHDDHCNFIACTYSGHFTAEQNTINARLIAAAPEMYEMLKNICDGCMRDEVKFMERDESDQCDTCEINALLKKAKKGGVDDAGLS